MNNTARRGDLVLDEHLAMVLSIRRDGKISAIGTYMSDVDMVNAFFVPKYLSKSMQIPDPHPEQYDVVVLGSGEAGKYIAWTLAKKGMRAVGVEAGEIIATVQVAMLAGLPYTVLRDAIFTHLTMLEGLIPLFSSVPPRPS